MYKIGTTEIIVFVTTLLAVLATDLIIGIGIGILCNYLLFIIGKVSISTIHYQHHKLFKRASFTWCIYFL